MSTCNNMSVQLMVSKTNYYTKACDQNNLNLITLFLFLEKM